MIPQGSPRRVVTALLRGEPPVRPLLMPLTFSLASRIENAPLGSFVTNPTKIVNALRQVHATLALDGVTCYFDPFLEVEALGGKIEWNVERPALSVSPEFASIDKLRTRCATSDRILNMGRVPVVAEVLKRLKVLLKNEPALVVGITGPFKLAGQLTEGQNAEAAARDVIEFAAELTAALAQHFVDSGADVILLNESLPTSSEIWQCWRSLLEPVINVVRFYEALPVLLLDEIPAGLEFRDGSWDCVLCTATSLRTEVNADGVCQNVGMALPTSLFGVAADNAPEMAAFRRMVEQVKPVLVTTAADLPANADLKQVARSLAQFRQVLSSVA